MEYGSEWAYNNIEAWAFRKQAFQAQHQYHYSLSDKSIHTLENKVLMHQCAISAKDINLHFEFWDLNIDFFQQVTQASWLALSYWRGMGEASF